MIRYRDMIFQKTDFKKKGKKKCESAPILGAMRPESDRDTFKRMRSNGFTMKQCSLALGVTTRTLRRWNATERKSHPHSRIFVRKMAPDQAQAVLNHVEEHKTSSLHDLQAFTKQDLHVEASISTIWRVLHENDYTHKKASKRYTEANLERQNAFRSDIQPLLASQRVIALDEAAFFLNHARRYAWAKRGQRAVVPRPGVRGKMHSLLLAVSMDGVVAWRLFEGAVIAQRFSEFLKPSLSTPRCCSIMLPSIAQASPCLRMVYQPSLKKLKHVILSYDTFLHTHLNSIQPSFASMSYVLKSMAARHGR